MLFSISSNGDHGQPRTNADKRKAVRLLLADAEWSQWSDREIARRCQVSQNFVSKLRKGASDIGCQMRPRKVRRGKTIYEMQAAPSRNQTAAPDHSVHMSPVAASTPAADRLGNPLPPETAAVFASLLVFEAIVKCHAQLAELVDELPKARAARLTSPTWCAN